MNIYLKGLSRFSEKKLDYYCDTLKTSRLSIGGADSVELSLH